MHAPRFPVLGRLALGASSALLASCAVGPDFVKPGAPSASRFTHAAPELATLDADKNPQHLASGNPLNDGWWRLFKSDALDAVMAQSLASNPSLQAAEASLRQSRDTLRAGYGVFYPHAQAALDASREHTAAATEGLATPSETFTLVTLTGSVSYALDVFGGQRRTVEGLRAAVQYQRFEAAAAYLSLSANVVDTSIARAAYRGEILATQRILALQHEQLDLIEVQYHSGTAAYSSVLAQVGLITANEALLAPLRQKADEADDLLSSLEGEVPSASSLPDIDLATLAVPAELPLSLPSDLVRQRPDILAAEAQLHEASANIGVATAALFPSFSLSGTYGGSGSGLGTVTPSSGRFWSVGPTATIPLFQGGSLWYGRRAAMEAFQQSQATYRLTVLAAFAQVADCLHALEHDAQALRSQVSARDAADQSLALLQANYRAGIAAYADVLGADVQAHQASANYLQALAQRHQDTVALFAALGGGWWNASDSAGQVAMP